MAGKITNEQIDSNYKLLSVGSAIDDVTAKTTPVDADTVPIIDSAASNVLKKLSWSNIKATLKAWMEDVNNTTFSYLSSTVVWSTYHGSYIFEQWNNIDTISSTTYTLELADNGGFMVCQASGNMAVTVPPNSSIAFPIGTEISFLLYTAYELSFSSGSGVTIIAGNSYDTVTTQYNVCTLKKISTDLWVLIGAEA